MGAGADRRRGGARAEPREGLFRDIVLAPDREVTPDAAPLVAVGSGDDKAFRREVDQRAIERHVLRRRGVEHGTVAVLKPEGLVPPRARRRRREALESERWVAARPIFLPQAADSVRPALLTDDVGALHRSLSEPSGLASHLERRAGRLADAFRVVTTEAELFDPERDLARAVLANDAFDDLWVKTGRLSNAPEDDSLRMRLSFGVEGDDDASRDEPRHRAVRELATRLLPGASALERIGELQELLERHAGGKPFFTQHIAYWNGRQGGARFHHDAFDAPPLEQQRAVVYTQLTGRTVWLALSIEDMGARVREFVHWLESGDLPWVREQVAERWNDLLGVVERRAPTLAELARPGCGLFADFVDAPEFTTFLVDAGHALCLHPGDVLVLPNHGLDRTAMHSVFGASKEPGYALSVAVRV